MHYIKNFRQLIYSSFVSAFQEYTFITFKYCHASFLNIKCKLLIHVKIDFFVGIRLSILFFFLYFVIFSMKTNHLSDKCQTQYTGYFMLLKVFTD